MIKTVLPRAIGALIIIYLLGLTIRAIVTNLKINQEIGKVREEVARLDRENKALEEQIAYYKTPQFREREARRKLGLVKPDEKVVVIGRRREGEERSVRDVSGEEGRAEKKANWILWWEYFTKD